MHVCFKLLLRWTVPSLHSATFCQGTVHSNGLKLGHQPPAADQKPLLPRPNHSSPRRSDAPALLPQTYPTELTFKGPIDMGDSKRGLEEGTSRDDSYSLVNLVNDGHQASLFLDLDLRRQKKSLLPGYSACSPEVQHGTLHSQVFSPPEGPGTWVVLRMHLSVSLSLSLSLSFSPLSTHTITHPVEVCKIYLFKAAHEVVAHR